MTKPIVRVVVAAVAVMAISSGSFAEDATPRFFVDSDSANEIDDLFAITRLLRQRRARVVTLSSAQWNHEEAAAVLPPGQSTVDASQQRNEALVRLCRRPEIPTLRGAAIAVGHPWGGRDPRPSAAAEALIRHAREASPSDKLTVVCLGATTNVASALTLAPDIIPRVRVALLGFQYNPERRVWNKSEFNIRRDLNAADQLLDTEGLELLVMPANIAEPLRFERTQTQSRLAPLGELGGYLDGQWTARFNDDAHWVMWDVALVEALLEPSLATLEQRPTPPENIPREVGVYIAADTAAMKESYWRGVLVER